MTKPQPRDRRERFRKEPVPVKRAKKATAKKTAKKTSGKR